VSVFLLIFVRTAAAEHPAAVRLISAVAWLCIGTPAAAFLLYRLPRTKPLVVRILTPGHAKMILGVCAGFAVSNPMVFPQYRYFFDSIQVYDGYVNRDRMTWPILKNISWYVGHYLDLLSPARATVSRLLDRTDTSFTSHFDLLSPDRFPLVLLAVGSIWIVARRDRTMLPYVVACALAFVSKPINVIASHHHMLLWFPFFFMICAYPIGKLYQALSDRLPIGNVWPAAALASFMLFLVIVLPYGPIEAAAKAREAEVRLHNVTLATEWIKGNVEPKALVALAYRCFNPDAFYAWLRHLQVPMPPEVLDGRDYLIWWGQGSVLRGKTGFACVTRGDLPMIKTRVDLNSPGDGTDPYADRRFSPVQSFGSGKGQVDIFRFDYR
jgi:hypothetical protein